MIAFVSVDACTHAHLYCFAASVCCVNIAAFFCTTLLRRFPHFQTFTAPARGFCRVFMDIVTFASGLLSNLRQ